jgi:hypothetical protein
VREEAVRLLDPHRVHRPDLPIQEPLVVLRVQDLPEELVVELVVELVEQVVVVLRHLHVLLQEV